MDQGIHAFLGVPDHVKVYLDNGAFYFIGKDGLVPEDEYNEFVREARPDWWPIPQDFIPVATLSVAQQSECFARTMAANLKHQQDSCTPVIHISNYLHAYTSAVLSNPLLAAKPSIALGGIVPNLLRKPKAIPHQDILNALLHVREEFADKQLHVFGIGGTATIHIASLLDIDSADSSGWRNRAARGIVQLPGTGDRSVANLGSWRGRAPSEDEWERLAACPCPACKLGGLAGLQTSGSAGFCNRATHNLWTLLEETTDIEEHLPDNSYQDWYMTHLDNTIYLPLIKQLVDARHHKAEESSVYVDPVA
ncbi:MAG TPA: hypothetical protein VH591_18780 [Ktedonobacterales bacterium]|jgi:queuine/archaeosine tRNA-ribosyltransferase